MQKEDMLKIKKERLNRLNNSGKNIKSSGVVKKLTRQIRSLEKEINN